MSPVFDSRLGEQLYALLPEVYRTRDSAVDQAGRKTGREDLAKYLDALGHLLDLIRATLEQQLVDGSPETSQDWLLPYFAQLLAANIVSPEAGGKHAEIANAVSWRQSKGTLKCLEEIAEAVGQMEIEIQEGWKRVAMTPRIGMPIIPAQAWDAVLKHLDMGVPSEAARHPGLPAAMVDLRRPSRAVEAQPTNPAARTSRFGGIEQTWRQTHCQGAPCFPGSFDDVSRRTVDMRAPAAAGGEYHPKRLLVYAPPSIGFFALPVKRLAWGQRGDSSYAHLIEEFEEDGVRVIRNRTDRIVEITDHARLSPARPYRVEGLHFKTMLSVAEGGTLELKRVEAVHVQVDTFATDEPVLSAEDCLFNVLSVGSGSARLRDCTVLGTATLADVDAANCIFTEVSGTAISGVVQYSRIPDSFPMSPENMTLKNCTRERPQMFAVTIAYKDGVRKPNGAGVLKPDCHPAIYAGGSDGAEMGYFHKGRREKPVFIRGDQSLVIPAGAGYPLADIIFCDTVDVDGGMLSLIRCAARTLEVATGLAFDTDGRVIPSLDATDCLFDRLELPNGLARLVYCTVMQATECQHLQASDCIFAGSLEGVVATATDGTQPPAFHNCVRYSCLPAEIEQAAAEALRLTDASHGVSLETNTMDRPVFNSFAVCTVDHEVAAIAFGRPGYGMLDPVSPKTIRFGAEDGGEMGAGHHRHFSLKAAAVLDKMREFLPVGIEPVLIQDSRLWEVPPEQPLSEESTSSGGES